MTEETVMIMVVSSVSMVMVMVNDWAGAEVVFVKMLLRWGWR